MNVGLLGYGSIARSHMRALEALAKSELASKTVVTHIMGRLAESTEAFAQEFGIGRFTTDLDTLLADNSLDAVIICSPTELHADQVERVLRAGKHALCEIPLATSLLDTDRLIALSTEMNRCVMVCHTQRYYAPLIEARRLIETGALHPHAITSRYGFHRRENINWMGRRRSWTDNLIWHHGCHAVDAALWLLGVADASKVVDVTAHVALPNAKLGIPLDFTIVMRTERDQIVTVAMSYNTHIPIHDYLIIGQENTLVFDGTTLVDSSGVIVPAASSNGMLDPIARQDYEFFDAIEHNREPAISARTVRPAMAALQTAQDALDQRIVREGANMHHPDLPSLVPDLGPGRVVA